MYCSVLTSALYIGKLLISLPGKSTHGEGAPSNPLNRRTCGPRRWPLCFGKKENLLPRASSLIH